MGSGFAQDKPFDPSAEFIPSKVEGLSAGFAQDALAAGQ
jgi:hypothetical protein